MNETQSININNSRIKQIIGMIYDSKTRLYSSAHYVRTTEEAIRSFRAAATQTLPNGQPHEFKQFAEDFTLWVVGYFYPETGVIEPCDKYQIASASEFA